MRVLAAKPVCAICREMSSCDFELLYLHNHKDLASSYRSYGVRRGSIALKVCSYVLVPSPSQSSSMINEGSSRAALLMMMNEEEWEEVGSKGIQLELHPSFLLHGLLE